MKLVFKKVKIENFLSIGEAEIDLANRGYTLVQGVNNNPTDMAKSNGSGKSSLLSSVVFAITGETINGIKDVANLFNPGGCMVELHFNADGDEYILVRYKDHHKYKTDLKIYKNGNDISGKGVRDSQKILEQHLPDLTSQLLGSVIFLGQGLPQSFTKNTPSGRKEVLEKLSKSDFMIEDLKSRVATRKIQINKEIRAVEDKLLELNTKINVSKSQLSNAQQSLTTLENPEDLKSLLLECENKLNEIESILNDFKEEENTLIASINILNEKKHSIELQILEEKNNALSSLKDEKTNLVFKQNELKSEINTLNNEINKVLGMKDTCPTCGQKLQNVVIPDITPQQERVKMLEDNVRVLSHNWEEIEKNIREVSTQYDLKLANSLTTIMNDLGNLNESLTNIKNNIRLNEMTKSQLQSQFQTYRVKINEYNIKLENINNTIKQCNFDIEKFTQETVYYGGEKDTWNNHLVAINSMNTIVTRDFRGYLLKNIIEYIDMRAKIYCQEMFNHMNMNFELNGNNIDVKFSGKQFETLSGGEAQKISIIIQLSLRDMLCQYLNFRCNILALDEITDNCDATSTDKIFDILSKFLTDIDSVFIITHHTDISIPQDSTITVVKDERGVSYIGNC